MTEQYRVVDRGSGREVAIGTVDEVREAFDHVVKATGGSSGGGAWSILFGFGFPDDRGTPWRGPLDRLAWEAADLRETCDESLDDEARAFLDRLVRLLTLARGYK